MSDPLVFARLPRVRGAVARSVTWWGKAWVRSFEETVVEPADLARARSLARSGRLGAVVVLDAMSSVVVDPNQPEAVLTQLSVRRLDDREWSGFSSELHRESGHLAALETGHLPAELVEAADERGIELIPGPADLETACECDAWAQPCLHALALLYQLAWLIDRDPWVLVLLRGRTREQLLEPDVPATPELDEAAERAAQIIALAEHAPAGHGLADSAVAAYDEEITRLLGD